LLSKLVVDAFGSTGGRSSVTEAGTLYEDLRGAGCGPQDLALTVLMPCVQKAVALVG
jgi:hypothetical protein